MYKHYDPEHGKTSEEIKTEDGKYKYWRPAVPMALETGLIVKRYECSCGRKFPGKASYELHYRKAYEEEKHVATELAGIEKYRSMKAPGYDCPECGVDTGDSYHFKTCSIGKKLGDARR